MRDVIEEYGFVIFLVITGLLIMNGFIFMLKNVSGIGSVSNTETGVVNTIDINGMTGKLLESGELVIETGNTLYLSSLSNEEKEKIKVISFSDDVHISEFGENAFSGMQNLKKVNIPKTVTKIDEHAFNGCSSLSRIYIPKTVNTIKANAFETSNLGLVINCEVTECQTGWSEDWNKYDSGQSTYETNFGIKQ